MAAFTRTVLSTEVEMDPAIFFEYAFTERTAQLREQVEQLREELECGDAGQQGDRRAEHDHG